ncbi:hypothetical protein AK830_g7300 [Neonectria ditissima]|uniref:PD-(D/E)XK nuclease-like domain-containing protein n=1 Tax=Neonectria ditissima TaxID=78410 RepID=A0A0P7BFW3_9HYPO|nr:hypothetical protein AK830_g7300 [Neonectria ditissima]
MAQGDVLAHNILEWLHNVSDAPQPQPQPYQNKHPSSLKRRRPLTPESTADMSSSHDGTPRKHKRPTVARDQDVTPRPTQKRIQTADSESDYSVLSASRSQSHSQRSGSQSPRKQLDMLKDYDRGVEIRPIATLKQPSAALRSFREKISLSSMGIGILPPTMKEPIQAHVAQDSSAETVPDFSFSEERHHIGHTPPLEAVLAVLEEALECESRYHGEAQWNAEVHSEILRMALRQPGRPSFSNLINYMTCPTASVVREYLPPFCAPKKIDFCIYIDPANDETISSAEMKSSVAATKSRRPGATVNHTNYVPLSDRPIALSIETKKPGEAWEAALLQLGVWKAAHWNSLEHLCEGQEQDQQEQEQQQDNPDSPRLPFVDFIPGIVIQGHDWLLVLSLREDEKTVLYSKINMGATNSLMGIYKIMHSLQVIRQWATDTYWPCVRQAILAGRETNR